MSEQKLPLRDRRLTAVTFGVAVFIVVLDQFTKYLAVTYLQNRPPVEVIGTWLQLTFLRNPGAAFSVGTSYTFIFTGIAIAVVVVIVRTSRNLGSLWWAIALGGLLGGATGNLLDRLFRARLSPWLCHRLDRAPKLSGIQHRRFGHRMFECSDGSARRSWH